MMQPRDELIREMKDWIIGKYNLPSPNGLLYVKLEFFYERIVKLEGERAVHDKLLELFGPGKGKCEECRFVNEWRGLDGIIRYTCPIIALGIVEKGIISDETRAKCPKMEE